LDPDERASSGAGGRRSDPRYDEPAARVVRKVDAPELQLLARSVTVFEPAASRADHRERAGGSAGLTAIPLTMSSSVERGQGWITDSRAVLKPSGTPLDEVKPIG
jgi:hypothetical protein